MSFSEKFEATKNDSTEPQLVAAYGKNLRLLRELDACRTSFIQMEDLDKFAIVRSW